MSFVLNQDFHSGYANENSTAYSILANNVKREVRKAVFINQKKLKPTLEESSSLQSRG